MTFAKSAIDLFSTLKQTPEPVTTAEPVARPQQQQMVVARPERKALLIGLESHANQDEAIYIHPALVMGTTIGDIELQDGDFVFAISSDDTSLTSELQLQHDSLIPAIGISPDFNAVDPTADRTIAAVLQRNLEAVRRNQTVVSLENVGVLRRSASGTRRAETFYLPLPGIAGENAPATSRMGTVRPRDVFLFTLASRSPVVRDRLITPAVMQLHEKSKALANHAKVKSNLPAGGSFISKAAANLDYYTRPIVRSARSVF